MTKKRVPKGQDLCTVVERTYTAPAFGSMPVIRSIALIAYSIEQRIFTPPNRTQSNHKEVFYSQNRVTCGTEH